MGADFGVSGFGYLSINAGDDPDNLDFAVGLAIGDRDAVGRFRPQLWGHVDLTVRRRITDLRISLCSSICLRLGDSTARHKSTPD